MNNSAAPATAAACHHVRNRSTSANSHRQVSTLRISPEIVGPIAGATEITIMMLPIVLPRDSAGTSVITVVISNGSMIAVPDA